MRLLRRARVEDFKQVPGEEAVGKAELQGRLVCLSSRTRCGECLTPFDKPNKVRPADVA